MVFRLSKSKSPPRNKPKASSKTAKGSPQVRFEDLTKKNGDDNDSTVSSDDTLKSSNDRRVKQYDLGSDFVIPELLKELWGKDADNVKDALSKISVLCDEENEHEDKNRHELCALGGPMAIVSVLKSHSEDAEIQALCCDALQNLSVDEVARSRVTSVGGIRAIVQAMENFPLHVHIQEWGIGALNNLYMDSKSRQNIAYKAGCLQAIIDAMKKHQEHQGIQQAVLFALRVFFERGSKTQELILDFGGFVGAAKAAEAQLTTPAIKEGYIKALSKMLKTSDDGSTLGGPRLLSSERLLSPHCESDDSPHRKENDDLATKLAALEDFDLSGNGSSGKQGIFDEGESDDDNFSLNTKAVTAASSLILQIQTQVVVLNKMLEKAKKKKNMQKKMEMDAQEKEIQEEA